MWDYLLLLIAALGAGVLSAAAGGGSFLTLPALLLLGLPPTTANATSATALLPGYISSLLGFRRDIAPPAVLGTAGVVVIALAGGLSGALLLLATGNQAFSVIVPWLMALATLLFALAPWIKKATQRVVWPGWLVAIALFIACAYGGYFNGGVGIILIALLNLLGQSTLLASVATKALFSAVLGSISVATYAFFGLVAWPLALLMMLGTITGGLLGARWVRVLPAAFHRSGIVIIGIIMTILMFLR